MERKFYTTIMLLSLFPAINFNVVSVPGLGFPEGYSGWSVSGISGLPGTQVHQVLVHGENPREKGKKINNTSRNGKFITPGTTEFQTIRYTVTETAHICILLYDRNEKLLQELWDKKQEAGIYTLNLNMDQLSKGIYWVTVSRNGVMKQSIQLTKY